MDVYGFSALLRFIQQWKSLFQQYDRDQSGSISCSELQQGGRGAETLNPALPELPGAHCLALLAVCVQPGLVMTPGPVPAAGLGVSGRPGASHAAVHACLCAGTRWAG